MSQRDKDTAYYLAAEAIGKLLVFPGKTYVEMSKRVGKEDSKWILSIGNGKYQPHPFLFSRQDFTNIPEAELIIYFLPYGIEGVNRYVRKVDFVVKDLIADEHKHLNLLINQHPLTPDSPM